ncbi:MAG: phosphoribosyltransferase [Polyangiaceae bacterium]|nr:phosphoribosyltransferase [Polyangiaceae bacterium]
MFERFRDREDAGRRLAVNLSGYASAPNVLILALPRGGVPVGFEVARSLKAPLDIFTVRKLGVPGHEELAMGAIASGGTIVLNDEIVAALRIPEEVIRRVAASESAELQRRDRLYRGDAAAPAIAGRTVILVDDGLATGASMKAAVSAVRQLRPRAVVVAVPVGARDTCTMLRELADDVICAESPYPFHAVGIWYQDFSQTTDDEVRHLLQSSRPAAVAQNAPQRQPVREGRGRL